MRQSSRITFRSTFRIKISDRERDTLIGYAGDVSECGMKLLGDSLVEPGSELKPVSYTHLDVYKRQLLQRLLGMSETQVAELREAGVI